MRRSPIFAVLAALVFSACPPTQPAPDLDAGEEPVVPFDGPTSASGVPDFFPPYDAGDGLVDSGVIVLDLTCCETNFNISDQEPADGVGVLRIGLGKFHDGVPLARDGGRWTATACFPVNQSSAYFYEFTFDGGIVDAGNRELADGGIEAVELGSTVVTQRASEGEPSFTDSAGQMFNIYRAVTSCEGLDGSVPRP